MKKIPFLSTLKEGDSIVLDEVKNIRLDVEWAPSEEFGDSYRIDICFCNTGAIYQFDTDRCKKGLLAILNQGEETAKKNLVKYFEGK